MTIRVVVADDQELVRTGLTMILDAQPGIEVIGQAADVHRRAATNRQVENLLGDLRHPFEDRPAAGQYDPRVE